jgi:hypothetical protein
MNGPLYCPVCRVWSADHRADCFLDARGVMHAAPKLWIIGQQKALELRGRSPVEAMLGAWSVWIAHCETVEAGV